MSAKPRQEIGPQVDQGQIQVVRADGVAWVTLQNPGRHNALTIEMSLAITEMTRACDDDEAVRVIVLRGGGERAFMSGADIGQQGGQPERFRRTAHEMLDALANVSKPVLAMIHGYCIGGGMAVALQADVRLASEASTFAVPAAKLGIAYPYNSIAPLLALVGPAATAEILFTGRRLDATEAYRLGLVQHLFAPEQLEAEAQAYASAIAKNAPLSIRSAKRALRAARPSLAGADLALLQRLLLECEASEDYQEGQAAFGERREPRFTGR